MEKDILTKVIEVEKEIQEKLREEKSKAHEWLEGVKKEIEKDISLQEEQLRELYTRGREDAKAEAEREAARVVQDAATLAERYRRIGDETLEKIVKRHVVKILPAQSTTSPSEKESSGTTP
jgi:vacuolar-type H+-ATPase subunit H